MITTVDGVTKYPGGIVWFICCSNSGTYYPKRQIVSPMDAQSDHEKAFGDKNLCKIQCDLLNQSNKI